ncbi:uracil-DNA glycosylase [Psychrosphaera sp. B3R10]|uniref:uracil-DNA glycosylase n=1 Tax=unclassified Psychrosphaera TaxID=2641570 RepID=UPI001C0924F6|nr:MULTISPECIES: uracil-DNA glycosylase [unclassified Psychrosphaera]MBU2882980.1 uracil-DNA glycosylase [Psychrosphaera sp. I2R16]MBU2991377.1 uracil-DNA glycosylase [Psychrosphaera sp. B3R10]MDO6720266.1 uracil-DNA glycosylase [Psychrosphaera sp. 1_MG-2023]
MNWQTLIEQQKQLTYFQQIEAKLAAEVESGATVYPPQKDIFSAFDNTQFDQVKVVILGQDPYHGPNQAHGMSFSVLPGIKIPPSLRNMYKELALEYPNFEIPTHGFLQSWADQGVLLINSVLTVRAGEPNSHQKWGWDIFTDNMIAALNQHRSGIVFLLWGAFAQKKQNLIDPERHHILTAPHPSPLSARRGFFGCDHFIKTNDILVKQNMVAINWQPPLSLS